MHTFTHAYSKAQLKQRKKNLLISMRQNIYVPKHTEENKPELLFHLILTFISMMVVSLVIMWVVEVLHELFLYVYHPLQQLRVFFFLSAFSFFHFVRKVFIPKIGRVIKKNPSAFEPFTSLSLSLSSHLIYVFLCLVLCGKHFIENPFPIETGACIYIFNMLHKHIIYIKCF